jgi:hypothetical protein
MSNEQPSAPRESTPSESAPRNSTQANPDQDDVPSSGPSLTFMYSLIALALVAAIGFAILIVLPFYNRR